MDVSVWFVDTHCHLNFDTYQDTIHEVVNRALESGVNKIVVPGVDYDSSMKAVELASRFDCVYASVGIHPSDAHQAKKGYLQSFEKLVKEIKVVAVGEVGLDFYHHPETKTGQLEILDSMLSLASDNQKPVILHSRNALDLLIEIINQWVLQLKDEGKDFLGVFHSFEGNAVQGLKVRSLRMAMGIGGPVTFRNALEKQNMIQELGIQNLVLETDSPFLSPHPFRGIPNEPARIPVIGHKISELLGIPLEEVAQVTTANARLLFRWDD